MLLDIDFSPLHFGFHDGTLTFPNDDVYLKKNYVDARGTGQVLVRVVNPGRVTYGFQECENTEFGTIKKCLFHLARDNLFAQETTYDFSGWAVSADACVNEPQNCFFLSMTFQALPMVQSTN